MTIVGIIQKKIAISCRRSLRGSARGWRLLGIIQKKIAIHEKIEYVYAVRLGCEGIIQKKIAITNSRRELHNPYW